MKLKSGVKLSGLQPEAALAIFIANSVYTKLGYEHTVTSVLDGKHKDGSLHYKGFAFDNRTWADSQGTQLDDAAKDLIARELRQALGNEFDVVVEATHIHIEFDPDD